MSELPRASVVSILETLLAAALADAARFKHSAEHHEGRASGLQTAIDLLTKDEDYFRRRNAAYNSNT